MSMAASQPVSEQSRSFPVDTIGILSAGRLAADLYAIQVDMPLSAVKQFNL
jgi:hypothetical protein